MKEKLVFTIKEFAQKFERNEIYAFRLSKPIKILIIIISLLAIYINDINFKFNKYLMIFNQQKKNTIKICMCSICRKENLYIEEFINHYKKLGYNHIFLYDNNNLDEEKIGDAIPKNEINNGFVSIINFRGKNPAILEAYRDCYEKYNKVYDWLSFYDIDEHLEIKLNNTHTIQNFFNDQRFKICKVIKINWFAYNDNNRLYYEKKSLKERFTEGTKYLYENRHVKVSVRGNLSYNYWFRAKNAHSSFANFSTCSSSGKSANPYGYFIFPADYEGAILHHYGVKTIEEYCNKVKERVGLTKLNYRQLYWRFFFFFQINQKTKEKVDYFNKKFTTNFN